MIQDFLIQVGQPAVSCTTAVGQLISSEDQEFIPTD